MADYLIGYGSLINPAERWKAGLPVPALATGVLGYRRSWNVRASNKKTYLGATASRSAWMNAVLFQVNEDQLSTLDGREGAYDRHGVAAEDVTVGLGSQARIWMYVPKAAYASDHASPEFAVKRSYVDIVITGCLTYGQAFCTEFIRTTDLWEQYWFDNRKVPTESRERVDDMVGQYYPSSMQVVTRTP